jgi:hypothetical protein
MRWETPPEEYDWQLPDAYAVQSLLLAGICTLTDERPNRTVSRVAPVRLRPAA